MDQRQTDLAASVSRMTSLVENGQVLLAKLVYVGTRDEVPHEQRELIETIGFQITAEDDQFYEAKLPVGWRAFHSEENLPMIDHFDIVDGRGDTRLGVIFDFESETTTHVDSRYFFGYDAYPIKAILNKYKYDYVIGFVKDCQTGGRGHKTIYRTPHVRLMSRKYYRGDQVSLQDSLWKMHGVNYALFARSRDVAQGAAEAWLNEQYPNWRDPLAYWGE